MNSERAREAQRIFKQALDVPAEEREQWVAEACGDADDLREDVLSLLESLSRSDGFLETPAVETEVSTPIGNPAALIGKVLGQYRIRTVLGVGGMGAVFVAQQFQPERIVALKVLRPGIWSPSVRRRLVYEAQILARLKHPNIAQVFEVDTHIEGDVQLPFFAMEFVEGAQPIDEYVRHRQLDQRSRIELFRKVCNAVHHGHQKGVIHRDLKPANILVDQTGEPKIIDFGVARIVNDDTAGRTLRTEAGQLLGTLQYMSPEQCSADPGGVDVRTDVYALGVVLYELLCGRAPYELTNESIATAVRIIQEQSPRRPGSVNAAIRGDLETIVLTALEKDPTRRYESASAFSDDLERYLNHEPIKAHPPSLLYQARLFARRNRLLVASIAAVLLALTAGIVGSLAFAVSANRARVEAEWQSYVGNIAAAESAFQASEYERMRTKLKDAATVHDGWELRYLTRLANPSLQVLARLPHRIDSVQYSASGRWVITGSRDGVVRILNANHGHVHAELFGHAGNTYATLTPDETRLVSAGFDGRVLLWDVASRSIIREFELGGLNARWWRPSINAEATVVACPTLDGTIMVWDMETGALLKDAFRHEPFSRRVALLSNGMLISCGEDGTIRFWDLSTREPARPPIEIGEAPVLEMAFSNDESLMCVGTNLGRMVLYETETWQVLREFEGHPGPVRSIVFSPDGKRIFTAGAQHSIGVWDLDTGTELAMFGGHNETIAMLDLHPDGSTLASCSWDNTVRLWDTVIDDRFDVLRAHDALVQTIAFSPDGATIVTGGRDNRIVITDAVTMQPRLVLTDHTNWVRSVAFTVDGSRLATCSTDRTVRIRDARTGDTECMIETTSTALSAAFSPDGSRIVVGQDNGQVYVYDAHTGQALTHLHRHAQRSFVVGWSPDGTRIVSTGWDGVMTMWDGATYEEVANFAAHDDAIYALAFSPDSNRLVTGGRGQEIGIWDAHTGAPIRMLRGHGQFVMGLAFNPDGTRLASASWFLTIKLWDTSRWEEVLTLHGGHNGSIRCLAFSADGSRIATGSEDSTVRFWDAISPQERRAYVASFERHRREREPSVAGSPR